jgi:hypothetical protein
MTHGRPALSLDQELKHENDVRTTLLQGLAGVLFLVTAFLTWLRIEVAREGQITDRFTRAVDQLGHRSPDVQTGAVYALERIAFDSRKNSPAIVEILAAFVRRQSPAPPEGETIPGWLEPLTSRNGAVQAALTVLGRSPLSDYHTDTARRRTLDLTRTDLRKAGMRDADLRGANLRHANLRGANIRDADLRDVDLRHAYLDRAEDNKQTKNGANLSGATLTGAKLGGARLTDVLTDARTVWQEAVADADTVWIDGSKTSDEARWRHRGITMDTKTDTAQPA